MGTARAALVNTTGPSHLSQTKHSLSLNQLNLGNNEALRELIEYADPGAALNKGSFRGHYAPDSTLTKINDGSDGANKTLSNMGLQ